MFLPLSLTVWWNVAMRATPVVLHDWRRTRMALDHDRFSLDANRTDVDPHWTRHLARPEDPTLSCYMTPDGEWLCTPDILPPDADASF